MASAISVAKRNRRPRRLSGEQRPMQREVPVGIASISQAGDDVTIVFNQPVNLSGVPQYLKNGTIPPQSAVLSSPTTLVLTYPAAGPIATNVSIPAEDPSIRNSSGGYVSPTTVSV